MFVVSFHSGLIHQGKAVLNFPGGNFMSSFYHFVRLEKNALGYDETNFLRSL